LPPAAKDGGRALQQHLTQLGQGLAQLAASPAFRDEVAMTQERLTPRMHRFALPQQTSLTRYKPGVARAPAYLGPIAQAMHWALSQHVFLLENAIAEFDFMAEGVIPAAIEQAGVFVAVQRL